MCTRRPVVSHGATDGIGRDSGGGGTTGGPGGGANSFNCPRCAVSLTKFWHQDSPLWGCVDCREIYAGRASEAAASARALQRPWASAMSANAITSAMSTSALPGGLNNLGGMASPAGSAAPSLASAAGSGAGEAPRFNVGELPPPSTIKAELDKYVIGQVNLLFGVGPVPGPGPGPEPEGQVRDQVRDQG